MDHIPPGIVDDTDAVQVAVRVPVHVSDGAVDHEVPQAERDEHRAKLHSVSESTTDERGGDDREGQLEGAEERLGYGGGVLMNRVWMHAKQPKPLCRSKNSCRRVGICCWGKRQTVSEAQPEESDETGKTEPLHGSRENILNANETCIVEHDARSGHEID
jgi:hypothetical protein